MDASRGTNYKIQWDQFYTSLPAQRAGGALWDVQPESAVGLDMKTFSAFFPRDLPLVDFGCGTGRQSAYLRRVWDRVLGMDISGKAIELAEREHQLPGLSFLAIDEEDSRQFQRLHGDMGDMNVYVRGVLHQVLDADRPGLVRSLKTLMGRSGRLYFIEVASDIRDYFARAPDRFSELPAAMQRVFLSRLPPAGLSVADIPKVFPPGEFRVLESGNAKLYTNLCFHNREPIHIPAVFGLVEVTGD
jgi:SAM-dependent methyltransferase